MVLAREFILNGLQRIPVGKYRPADYSVACRPCHRHGHMHVHTYVHMHARTHTYTHTHTYIHTYIHIRTHIHISEPEGW